MNYRQNGCTAKIVRRYNPHSIIRVWLVTENGKPMNEGALVEFLVHHERKEEKDTSN
jgi:hypothetical protein